MFVASREWAARTRMRLPAGIRPDRYRLARWGSLLLCLAGWEALGRRAAGTLTLPPVSAVLQALARQLTDARFWAACATTLEALAVGLVLLVALGIPLGLACGRYPLAGRIAEPYLGFLLAVPASPMVPVFVIAFGIGLAARVATIVAFALPLLVLNTAAGVRLAPGRLVEMARSFGAGEGMVFRRVILPAAMPAIGAGLRLASARAVVGMVVSELIIIAVGLGRLISTYSATFDNANLFAVVLAVLGIGLGVARLMTWVERKLAPWS